uniref:Uncharacterized protein n=1 Tax=Arundo donax TaxID=35708 RepID=A0A0A8ZFE8_ARUDO
MAVEAASRRGAAARRKAKEAAVGAAARVLFYPTLLYNVVRSKVQAEFRWWDEVDQVNSLVFAPQGLLGEGFSMGFDLRLLGSLVNWNHLCCSGDPAAGLEDSSGESCVLYHIEMRRLSS